MSRPPATCWHDPDAKPVGHGISKSGSDPGLDTRFTREPTRSDAAGSRSNNGLPELVCLDEIRIEAGALVAQPFIRSEEEQFLPNNRAADASCELPELVVHANWRSFDASITL